MSAPPKKDFYFYIDVVGTCNLKCPSCPVGNSKEIKTPKGIMDPEFLDKIMQKATRECNVTGVGLYNWTEPLLHPKLPELIRIVQSYGVPCAISTNLNILDAPDELMAANPHSIYVSLSGFKQEKYGITHLKGDIEKVKENVKILIESKNKIRCDTEITIVFHRYLNNRNDESLMSEFAQKIGVRFMPIWAQMMPLEKVLSYARKGSIHELSNSDTKIIQQLALPLDQALDIARRNNEKPCALLDQQITLTV